MKQLILKDIKSFGLFNVFIIILALAVGYIGPLYPDPAQSNGIYSIPALISAFVFIEMVTEKNILANNQPLFASMPVTKFDIVKSRYLTTFLYILFTLVLIALSSNISKIIFENLNGSTLTFTPLIFILSIGTFLSSIILPAQFYSGKVARAYNLIFLLILVFLPDLLDRLGLVNLSQATIDKILNANYKTISPILLVISLIFYTISLFISKAIYEGREF